MTGLDIAALRAELVGAVRRRQQEIAEAQASTEPKTCDHEWRVFRKTVHPDRPRASMPMFRGSGAYFVVKACIKCHEKRNVDYVVER